MKFIIMLVTSLPALGFAEDVKINSFVMIGQRSSAAELCGNVISPTGHPQMVKVIVDAQTKKPATYYIWSGSDGKFCTIVSTYSGEATAILDK